MAGELIVGYDGSDCARAALDQATRLARLFGTGLVIAYGYEPPATGAEMADHRAGLEAMGQRLTEEALASVSGEDVAATAVVAPGRPAEALLGLAEQHQARMIVVGTHGERPLVGAILGSVPHKLVHRSPVPVLVVPAGGR